MTVTVLRGRTSDRSPDGVRGSELLGAALGGDVRVVGEPSPPAVQGWEEDLAAARPVLEAAAAAVAGPAPVLVAAQCTIALATLPVIAAREPDAVVVWLDAHGDFNTPATSGSGYLGGMPLAAACGLWDGGYGAGLDASRVVLGGARDLDPAERAALDAAGVRRVALADVAGAVRGERRLPPPRPRHPRPAGHGGRGARAGRPALEELAAALRDLAAAATVLGVEITAFDDPEPERLAGPLAQAIRPVVPMG